MIILSETPSYYVFVNNVMTLPKVIKRELLEVAAITHATSTNKAMEEAQRMEKFLQELASDPEGQAAE